MKKTDKSARPVRGKFLLGMQLLVLLMFVVQIAFSAELAHAQNSISVQFENSSLKEILQTLKQKSQYEFLYNDEEIRNVGAISKKFTNATIEEILTDCLQGTKYGYKIVDQVIVITPRDAAKLPQEEIVVKGRVTDEQGEPLPGATVMIKGVKVGGVAADINGEWSITLPSKNVVLVISFVGMQSLELDVATIKDLSRQQMVKLKVNPNEMAEVVVTGYGNIRKESFTGSSISVTQEELLKVSKTNIISALQTFDPSFRIQTNNQWGSDPNALPEMYIRGRSGIGIKELDKDALSKSSLENNPNLPTFIMDGFQVNVQKVYDLDPTRIANITILKDAAATAMYGSRAANGVVVITTVAPKPGEVRVTYSFNGSVTMPDLTDYNLANAAQKLEIERLSGLYDAETPEQLLGKIDSYTRRLKRVAEGVDTDWKSIPLRNVFNHKHSLYVEGGTDELRYGLDASYNNSDGVMKKSYRDRYGLGFYVDYRLKKLQIRNYISYNYMKAQESPYGTFSDYTRLLPYDRPYDENGILVKKLQFSSDRGGITFNNPLYEALLGNFQYSKYDEVIDNVSLNWYINDYWSVKGQFSITKQFTKGEKFIDPLSSNSTMPEKNEEASLAGDLYVDKGESTSWDAQAFLYYQQTINKHSMNFSLGMNANSGVSENTSTHYRGFPSSELHSPNYAAEVYMKPTKTQNKTRLFGFVGSLNYTYNDIYLLDASARVDGSSEFGSNQKYAPFWSGGVGINIHKYQFMEGNEWINQLKLRASFGQTGKVNFAPYCATTTYEALTDEWYITGYGVKLKALGNADLSWEKTNELNVGGDFQFLKGRLTMVFDYYTKKTVGLITDVTIPASSGFVSYKDNLGEVKNTGFEIQLRGDVLRTQNWQLALWGNMAHNKNKILKISESLKAYNDDVNDYYVNDLDQYHDPKYAQTIPKYEEGGSLTSIFGMRSLGIDPATGKELFMNRDGSVTTVWDPTQQVIIGNSEPKVQGAFGFNLSWKQFSLFASFMYELGGKAYNETLVNSVENADIEGKNVDLRVLTDRWQKPGDVTPLKDIKDRSVITRPSSRFIQKNNFLSMTALTASYDFKTDLIRKIGLSVLRLEVSTNDIARFASIRQERGTSYPFARTVNFSVKLNF